MSIDTLRQADGTYRAATYHDAARTLMCGHTEHLQTERGIIAIRPVRAGGWNLTRSSHRDELQHFTSSLAAIRFILRHLNGSVGPAYEAGDTVVVEANQGKREGTVLAVLGDECLIEYEMPNGTSALRVVQAIGYKLVGTYKTMPHGSVTRRWIEAMREQGTTDWIGRGQRQFTATPFPA
jgi:hypothetical protein